MGIDVRGNPKPYMQSPNCTERLKLVSASYASSANTSAVDDTLPRLSPRSDALLIGRALLSDHFKM